VSELVNDATIYQPAKILILYQCTRTSTPILETSVAGKDRTYCSCTVLYVVRTRVLKIPIRFNSYPVQLVSDRTVTVDRTGLDRDRGPDRTEPWTVLCLVLVRSNGGPVLLTPENELC
jgi:hypothetical protein